MLTMHFANRVSRLGVLIALASASACSGSSDAGTETTGPAMTNPATIVPSESTLTYVAFGDSWPFGAHCNGCQPFPGLYADALAATTRHEIDFRNLTTNGGTSQDLLNTLKTDPEVRDAAAAADIIVISTGANDLDPAFDQWAAGTCGGGDQLECFRAIADGWRTAFEGILTEIDALRSGQHTAIRLLTNSNEFLFDPGLIALFGQEFGLEGGATITALMHEVLCDVAAEHGARCVDLRPVLNGPNFDQPQDVNTQAAMQAVADALLASGLDELGV